MKQWLVPCRVEFDGTAIVEADSAEAAAAKFKRGDFEFDNATAGIINWELRGKPELSE